MSKAIYTGFRREAVGGLLPFIRDIRDVTKQYIEDTECETVWVIKV